MESRLLDGNRNLRAMNQSPGDGGDGEGVSPSLGIRRGAATASPTSSGTATGRRGVSAAADRR